MHADDVHHGQHRERRPADPAVPQQHDRGEEAEKRQQRRRRGSGLGDPSTSAHLYPLGDPNFMARSAHFAQADSCSLVIMATLATLPRRGRAPRDAARRWRTTSSPRSPREVPDYARPMEGRFGETVRFGVEVALNRFVDLLAGEHQVEPARATPTVRLGAGEYRAGPHARRAARRLPRRRAARVAALRRRRHARRLPARRALRPRRGDVRLHRRDLRRVRGGLRRGAVGGRGRVPAPPPRGCCGCSCRSRAADAEAVRTAAQSAGWALPRLRRGGRRGRGRPARGPAAAHGEAGPSEELVDAIAARLARRLGPGAVGAAVGGLAVVMMPDPEGPGRRKALEAALRGELAALGPAVPWPEAAASLRRAEAAFRLAAQGRLLPPEADALGRTGRSLPARPVFGPRGRPVPRRGSSSPTSTSPRCCSRPRRRIAADLARTRLAPLDGARRGPAGAARGHAARVAGPARAGAGGRRRARRPPADRPLPAQAAARAVRGAAWRTRRPASSSRWPCARPTAFAIDVRHAPSRHGGRGHARHGCRRRRRRT